MSCACATLSVAARTHLLESFSLLLLVVKSINRKLYKHLFVQLACSQFALPATGNCAHELPQRVTGKFITLHNFTFLFALAHINHLGIALFFVPFSVLSFSDSVVRFNFPGQNSFRKVACDESFQWNCERLDGFYQSINMMDDYFHYVISNFGSVLIQFLCSEVIESLGQALLIGF